MMAYILHVHGVKDQDFIDFSCWPLHIPDNVHSLFYQVTATDYSITQHQLVLLPKDKKDVFVEIKTGQNCGPLTMNIFGLQQLGDGVHMYFKVVAEETFDLTEGVSPSELHLKPSEGQICTDSMFDLQDKNGPAVQICHKHGSKYWIKTPCGDENVCTLKIILLQQLQNKQTFMIFTENTWTLKSIPFLLQPGREYRCIVYYSSDLGSSLLLEVGVMNETNKPGDTMSVALRTHHFVQATKEKIVSIYFTKEELNQIKSKAVMFVHRKKQKVTTIPYFYRNKSVDYFADIIRSNNGVMYPLLKDNNGDRYSILNGNIKGIFFSALLLPSTLLPPKTSIFGTRRLFIRSSILLNHTTNMYFADFYCYNGIVHYLTIVLTKPDSPDDNFCQQNLVKLDIYNNPFLQITSLDGVYQVLVTLNVIVEIFYTESVDLMTLNLNPTLTMFEDVPLAGRGSSVEGGIPKRENCEICNLERSLRRQ